MAVKIRLTRVGRKKRPFYRIVVMDTRSPRDGRYIECLGTYNPLIDPPEITVFEDKVNHWLDRGAIPSDTVKSIFKQQGLVYKRFMQKRGFDEARIEEEMKRSDQLPTGNIILDGLTNVLSEPEFADSEEARRALRLLEERSLLHNLLSQTILPDSIGGVQVLIGGEGTWDDLSQCSMILSKYGSPGTAIGTIGVLGPMRMSYGYSISLVRFLSGMLSDFVNQQW